MQLLSMALCRIVGIAAVYSNYDASKAFDRILLAIAAIFARRAGAPASMIRANILIKQRARHIVQTASGPSKASYTGRRTSPR